MYCTDEMQDAETCFSGETWPTDLAYLDFSASCKQNNVISVHVKWHFRRCKGSPRYFAPLRLDFSTLSAASQSYRHSRKYISYGCDCVSGYVRADRSRTAMVAAQICI